ncbi:hypothetical protein GCM10020295_16810 [Streptomyces cinereospinus]
MAGLEHWWEWCLTTGRETARHTRDRFRDGTGIDDGTETLTAALGLAGGHPRAAGPRA